MPKILFINTNLQGHINPTLPLAKQLINHGNTVTYYCSSIFKDAVTETGADFYDYGQEMESFMAAYRPTGQHPFYSLIEYILRYTEALLPKLLIHMRENEYDGVICDSMFGEGYFINKILRRPIISSHSSFATGKAPVPPQLLVRGTNPQLDHCYEILGRICDNYQIPEPKLESIYIGEGDLNIVHTIEEVNGSQGLDTDRYVFNGPAIRRDEFSNTEITLQDMKQKLIYISLGTVNNSQADFYRLCIEAFGDSEYQVVMSIGKKCTAEELGEIPDNFIVRQKVPQMAVLKGADVFISHAGFNSMNEAMYSGVPVIAFPMANDQFMVANRLEQLNAGIVMKIGDITSKTLKDTVDSVVNNRNIKQNCVCLSSTMQKACQEERAVAAITKFMEER